MSLNSGVSHFLRYALNATDLPANTAQYLPVPPGNWHVKSHTGVVKSAITTGGTINLSINGTTTVDNMQLTFANSAAAGNVQSAVEPANSVSDNGAPAGDSTRNIGPSAGYIKVVPASFATAGYVEGVIELAGGND